MKASKSALTLLSGSGVNFALRFLRNVLVARLLTVADFGIASTLLIAMNLVQLFTNFNFGKMIVQHKAGDDPDFLAAIKTLNLLRSMLIALVLLLAAGPIAVLMGRPEEAWAYRWMALVPLMMGVMHPEMTQRQRRMDFRAQLLNNTGSMLLTLILVYPLYLWLGDFRVMLAIYIVEGASRVLLSHMVSKGGFRLGWDTAIAKEGFRFGWPLFLAGIITFAVLQGDRIIVSNFYGAHALGLLSAALTLTMTPMNLVGTMISTFFLPLLSRLQDDPPRFDHRAALVLEASFCVTAVSILGFALLGPTVLRLVFGEKFAEAGPYVALLGIAFALQLTRSGTVTIAMARASTVNMLIANAARMLFIPPAVWAAVRGHDVVDVLMIGAVGQIAGVAVSIWMLHHNTRLGGVRRLILPYFFFGLFLVVALAGIWMEPKGYLPFGSMALAATLVCLALIASCLTVWRMILAYLRGR